MLIAVTVVSLLLGAKAIYLSVADGGSLQALAAEQPGTGPDVAHGRGDILTADGRQLATSLERYSLVATPYQVENPDEVAAKLAEVAGTELGQTEEQIAAKLAERDDRGNLGGYSIIGTVEPGTADRIQELAFAGLTLTPTSVRAYPDGQLASQTTGYLGDYGSPFGGIESRYDEKLESGQDVTVTLDSAVQQQLEKELARVIEEHGAKSTLGLVMRINDGSIVALAGSPGFDNNEFEEASPELQRNRILTDPYEPGSTFKPFTMSAALEERAVSTESWFTVPDRLQVADRVIHDSEPHETKIMQPKDILEQSTNVGTIQVAQQLGGDQLEEYIRRFGFGETTGVDLWGEDPGVVPAYEDWSGSSIGNIPIGQGLTVTPLQLVVGYATLVNGGTRVEPHIAQGATAPEPGPRVISRETSDIVRGMLQNVVDNGSGHLAQIPGYTVGGKTGTSQKVDPVTGTYAFKHIASFIGFAPASDPEYVALIVVDEPQTEYWGEVVAAPAFQRLMSFTLGYFNVPPDAKPPQRAEGSTE
ncbi:MAG TPA: penicillin-binding protein 2 [Rubrobacteraceae bacterium]|nr:penicillin-binding protein 2 [Rubrobacteraceae bacterium]